MNTFKLSAIAVILASSLSGCNNHENMYADAMAKTAKASHLREAPVAPSLYKGRSFEEVANGIKSPTKIAKMNIKQNQIHTVIPVAEEYVPKDRTYDNLLDRKFWKSTDINRTTLEYKDYVARHGEPAQADNIVRDVTKSSNNVTVATQFSGVGTRKQAGWSVSDGNTTVDFSIGIAPF